MAFIRKIKKGEAIYLAEVENYRQDGKVKQRVIRYVGKEVNGQAVKRIASSEVEVSRVKQYLDYKVLHQLAERLGLPEALGAEQKRLLLLVYTQIVERKSIYKLPEYVEHTALQDILGFDKLIDEQLYEALDALNDLDFSRIEETILSKLPINMKERQALVLDVTDTYFSGSQASWKARRGKDGKYDKLIQVALAVTQKEGFPIMQKMYEGNISNIKIFNDMIAEVKMKNFDVTVLDRGMICYESINDLIALGQPVITGLRINEKLSRDCLSKIEREKIYSPKCCVKLKNTQVYVHQEEFMGGHLIAVYNPLVEVHKRDMAMEKPESYNPEKARYYGYSLIFHTTSLAPEEVLRTYYEKDVVEKAYRELKTNINLHPLRKYRLDRIQAHVKICYMAYAILSYMQNMLKPLKLTAVDALEKLQSAYNVELEVKKDNLKWTKLVTLTKLQKDILKSIGCSV